MRLLASTAKVGARLIERAPSRIRGSYRLRRAGRRMVHQPVPDEVPERPIGAKLELTYHCNLRCSFCYTDSPRRTLARTTEMSDERWRQIVEEAIALGVIEVVLTGGEPLLRRELALESIEELTEAGVMVTLTTNGWFLDGAGADRLAATGARVHVSLDGASPELHDASRGVPGGWRRAVEAIDLMLSRGSRVQVVHVVTPQNEGALEPFLDQMRVLAPTSLRIVPVGLIGAAARSGDWGVDYRRMLDTVMRSGAPGRPKLLVGEETPGSLIALDWAPRSFLVRPNGAFLANSLHPFSFGDADRQSLSECWEGLRTRWRDPRVAEWRAGARSGKQSAARGLVPYRDLEQVVAGPRPGLEDAPASRGPALDRAMEVLEAKKPQFPDDGRGDISAATARVRELALARRFRLGRVRWGGNHGGDRMVRVRSTGQVSALNRAASAVMEALDGGTAAAAVHALAAANPGIPAARIERDTLETVSRLIEAGIVVPALAPHDTLATARDEGSLSGLPD